MIRFAPILGFAALSLLVMPAFAQEPNGIRERDQHFRLSPAQQHQYDNYKQPRVYYPRKDRDRVKATPVPPRSPMASPRYGPPAKAIDRIPKT